MSDKKAEARFWRGSVKAMLAGGVVVVAALALATTALAAPTSVQPPGPFGPRDFQSGETPFERGQFLAEELGISLEDLEDATEAAFEATIEAAVESGDLTREEADEILQRHEERAAGERGPRPIRPRGRHGGAEIFAGFLAQELGISTEDLRAATEAAHEAAVEALLDGGYLSQEQVDRMEAARAFRSTVERGEIIARALGLDVEELADAREAGQTLRELLDEMGIAPETFRESVEAAVENAIDEAVDAGVITSDQAELLLETPGPGFGWGPGKGRGPRGGAQ